MTRQFVLALAVATCLAGPDRLSAQIAAPTADSLSRAWQDFAEASPQTRESRHKQAVAVSRDWMRGYFDKEGVPRGNLGAVLVRSHYNHLDQDPFGHHSNGSEVVGQRPDPATRASRPGPRLPAGSDLPARPPGPGHPVLPGRPAPGCDTTPGVRPLRHRRRRDGRRTGGSGHRPRMLRLPSLVLSGPGSMGRGAGRRGPRAPAPAREQDVARPQGADCSLEPAALTEANAVADRLPAIDVYHLVPTGGGLVHRRSRFAADWIRSQAQLSSGRPDLAKSIITKNLKAKFDPILLPFARQYWNDVGLVLELTAPIDAATYYDLAYGNHKFIIYLPVTGGTMKPIYAGLPDGELPFRMTFDRFYLAGSPFAYIAYQLAATEENWATAAGEEARGRVLDMAKSLAARGIRRDFCHAVQGRIALRDGDLTLAKTELLAARNAGVSDPDISLMLAHISLKTGDQAAAERYYREVVASSPGTSRAWQGLGISLAETGRFDLALEAMAKALACDSLCVDGWYNRGLILYKYGRLDDAEQDLLQARELAPDRPEVVTMLQAVNLAKRDRPR